MCAIKIAQNIVSSIQDKYIKLGSKITQKTEAIADSKIANSANPIKLWQDARSCAIRWQIKNTPFIPCGEHKKALETLSDYIAKMDIKARHSFVPYGPDKYDDVIYIGRNIYDTKDFGKQISKFSQKEKDSFADLIKKLNEYGEVWFYGNPKYFDFEKSLGKNMNDVLNDIYNSQERFPRLQYDKAMEQIQKRGY